jgi:hypothetical protein
MAFVRGPKPVQPVVKEEEPVVEEAAESTEATEEVTEEAAETADATEA